VIYNPIGVSDPRYGQPWTSVDESYPRVLAATYQTIRANIMRYVSHNPAAWTPEFEKYVRIRYAWTLSSDWARYAMVQALIQQVPYLDPVVNDWAHIKAPTLVLGGAEDSTSPNFKERMKFIAESVPGGNGRLQLLPGIGHVPHMEAPGQFYPPLVAFLKDGARAN
jgi:pimeloyl-ACP methyl ester carboxylesterase